MMVKLAPRLATILCLWFGRLAMPIGEALSAAVDDAMVAANAMRKTEGAQDGFVCKVYGHERRKDEPAAVSNKLVGGCCERQLVMAELLSGQVALW